MKMSLVQDRGHCPIQTSLAPGESGTLLTRSLAVGEAWGGGGWIDSVCIPLFSVFVWDLFFFFEKEGKRKGESLTFLLLHRDTPKEVLLWNFESESRLCLYKSL